MIYRYTIAIILVTLPVFNDCMELIRFSFNAPWHHGSGIVTRGTAPSHRTRRCGTRHLTVAYGNTDVQ